MWYDLVLFRNPLSFANLSKTLAGTTGLEPATSCVTGMRSNQLNYVPEKPVTSGK